MQHLPIWLYFHCVMFLRSCPPLRIAYLLRQPPAPKKSQILCKIVALFNIVCGTVKIADPVTGAEKLPLRLFLPCNNNNNNSNFSLYSAFQETQGHFA